MLTHKASICHVVCDEGACGTGRNNLFVLTLDLGVTQEFVGVLLALPAIGKYEYNKATIFTLLIDFADHHLH